MCSGMSIKLDLRLAVERGEESDRKIDPGAGGAGAVIEKAVGRGRIGDMQSHGNGILHVDEVSDLLPIPVVWSMALEKTHLAGSKDLLIGLGDQAAHLSLVSFVRAEDIEVFYADHLIEPPVALGMKVEEVLRIAVGIQRTQGLEMIGSVIHAAGTVTIGGGRTGINKADAALDRPLRETLGIAKVVLHQVTRVRLGGRGAGAEVKDGADRIKAFGLALETFEEGIGLLVVGEAQGGEVLPFLVPAEHIGDEDVLLPLLVQGMDQGTANESRATGRVTRMEGSMDIGDSLVPRPSMT